MLHKSKSGWPRTLYSIVLFIKNEISTTWTNKSPLPIPFTSSWIRSIRRPLVIGPFISGDFRWKKYPSQESSFKSAHKATISCIILKRYKLNLYVRNILTLDKYNSVYSTGYGLRNTKLPSTHKSLNKYKQ